MYIDIYICVCVYRYPSSHLHLYMHITKCINDACKQRSLTHTRKHTNADTEALRGSPVKRVISPKKSPGLSVATSVTIVEGS